MGSATDSSHTAILRRLFNAHASHAHDGLMGFVLQAVEEADWPGKHARFGLDESERYPSALLMVLEVYCYARGIYNSGDLVRHIPHDPELNGLFPGHAPSELLIKRFRRNHREPIRACLLTIFDIAFRVRFGQPDTDEAPIDACVALAIDHWFEPICGPQPTVEADQRLNEAVFWDGVMAA
jgi:hypothetical protein